MIRKCFLICIGLICTLLLIPSFFSINTNSIEIPKGLKLKNGDLILRCGKSTESYAVILADSNTEFSHIGIISIQNNTPYVIHAVPHKNHFIKKDKLTTFLSPKNASKYAVYRTKNTDEILKKVAFEAESFYTNKCTFDNDYNLKTNSKLYCTELVLKAFQNTGINLNLKVKEFNYILGKHPIIFPSEFTKTPLFYKII